MKKKLIKISNWICWTSLILVVIATFGSMYTNAFSATHFKPHAIYWLCILYTASGLFMISAVITFITDMIMSPTLVEK